jgi:rhodanese-related sulfurtransferase
MKTRLFPILVLLVTMSLLVVACGGQATPAPAVEEAVPAPTEVVVEEPTAVLEEPKPEEEPVSAEPIKEATEADLDSAYTTFLVDMEAYNTIGLDALNEMMAESPPFLLDVRSQSEVEDKGYIEGSVLVPLRDLGENLDVLPAFDETIVSYCGSGWRCTIALTALEALGWEDVKGLKGGSFSGWVEAGYPFVEGLPPDAEVMGAAVPDPGMELLMANVLSGIPEGWGGITAEALNTELAENPDLFLIDSRRLGEVEEKGTIEAANFVHIPLEDFVAQQDLWPADKDAPVVVYCGSGHRSTIAMTILWSYGYTDVRSLKGGFGGWASAGYPVLGGAAAAAPDLDGAYDVFLADMEAYNTISLDGFNALLAEEPPPFVLDVRQPNELTEKGWIESAVNIPLREVAQNIDLLPSFDTTIVSYCGSGWRCTIAMTALEALGWEDVLSLKGGSFGGWVEAGYPFEEGTPPEPFVLDVAAPDAGLLALMDETLSNVPEGYGGITADALNTELVENPDLFLIDSRRLEEVEEKGVIEAANFAHIPLEDFVANQAMWPADKDATVVVYCGSGHRSTIAMTILWSYGYTDVRSLKGGFGGWVEAEYPVVEFAMP